MKTQKIAIVLWSLFQIGMTAQAEVLTFKNCRERSYLPGNGYVKSSMFKEIKVDQANKSYQVVMDFKELSTFGFRDIQVIKMGAKKGIYQSGFSPIQARYLKSVERTFVGEKGAPYACDDTPELSTQFSIEKITTNEIHMNAPALNITSGRAANCQDWTTVNLFTQVICRK